MNFTLFKKKEGKPKKQTDFRIEDITKKAQRDWGVMLIVFIVFNLALGGGAAYFFNRVNSGTIFVSDEVFTQTAEIDVSFLKKIVDQFDAKQDTFESVKINALTQIDPSL